MKERLHYDPETGLFTYLKSKRTDYIGKIAGSVHRSGYVVINLDGDGYRAHRLAFLYMEGKFPPNWVDHINRVRGDNRWSNLRHADAKLNANNRKIFSNSVTGLFGICASKWGYQVRIKGKYLGLYQTIETATKVRDLYIGQT